MSTAQKVASAFLYLESAGQRVSIGAECIVGTDTGFQAQGLERRHFVVKYHQQHYFLMDLNSRQGVLLNNSRIPSMQWIPLALGMSIQAGALDLRFGASASGPKKPQKNSSPPTDFEKAALPSRIGAYLVDQLLLGIIFWLLPKSLQTGSLFWISFAALMFAVFVVPMATMGKSFGKLFLGLKVVYADDTEISWWTAIKREILFKLGAFLMVPAMLAGVCAAINPLIAPLAVIGFYGLVLFKMKQDEEIFWDSSCETIVVTDSE